MYSLAIHGRDTWKREESLGFIQISWISASVLGCAPCKPQMLLFLQGVKDYSVPVGLDGKAQVDLVVVGSVAVSEKGKEKLPGERSQIPAQCQRGHTTWQRQIYPWSWGLGCASVWDKSLLPVPAGSSDASRMQ